MVSSAPLRKQFTIQNTFGSGQEISAFTKEQVGKERGLFCDFFFQNQIQNVVLIIGKQVTGNRNRSRIGVVGEA